MELHPVDIDVPRSGGRVIRSRSIGDESLRVPVLYMHGTPESRLTLDFALRAGCSGGRLISFDRPGYGGSDHYPFSLQSVADDAEAVVDALGISRFAVLGHSGGGPFALAIAARLPSRVTAVGISAGPGSYAEVPGAWESLTEIDRRAAEIALIDTFEAARLFGVDFEAMANRLRADEASVREYLLDSLPRDRAVLELPGFLEAFTASLKEGVRRGVLGCAWDNVAWVPRWDFSLRDVHQPVSLWYGAGDETMPVGHGKWLQGQLSHCHLTVWEDAGHLGLFSDLSKVVDSLAGEAS